MLAVGTLEPRKNLARTIEATARLGLELRVVGARGWGGVEAQGGRVTPLGEVSDEELARQYRGALCVVYPSLYEGFGIPVLEAMACGAPVVTSAGGATEEVAGGAAVLVDPTDVAAIADGIEEAIRRRDELRALGLERTRAFSWDETARLTRCRVSRGGGVSDPLVVIDADVLGRRRTGDETYVRELLRALPAVGRRAAVRGDHTPARPRAVRHRADRAARRGSRSCGWPCACRCSCAACGPRSRTSSTRCRRRSRARPCSPCRTSPSSATRR